MTQPSSRTTPDLTHVSEDDWSRARKRLEAIQPLLTAGPVSKQAAKQYAAVAGVHVSTLYRWLEAYRQTEQLMALLPRKPGVEFGDKRLPTGSEEMVSLVIKQVYLTRQRPSVQHVAAEIIARCRDAGIAVPHPSTIRRRIARIPEHVDAKYRKGSQAARVYEPLAGNFPTAEGALGVVQIDHTKVDVILVDDLTRQPVGRPWITVAIDIFCRMIAGFYVSFDPPGAMSTGLCLAHAMLPKRIWLAKYGITTPWPICGRIKTLHLDNAKEFHGTMLDRACQNYGIELQWRPVKKPWYGGHIERWLGTFAQELKNLPGATFSNPTERGEYDSEGRAALTLTEFERWLATFITEVYHQRVHSALGVAPIQKYESTDPKHADWNVDERRLRLDFMPYLERTVQPYGILIDQIAYYSDVLRRWVSAADSEDPAHKRKFTVRRDPRDISVVYFWDPEAKEYFRIPYRDTAHPAISLWELKEIRRQLQQQGRESINEDLIFAAYSRMREIADAARRTTKAARRDAQRRRDHSDAAINARAESTETSELIMDLSEVKPFEIEEL
jgi:putative transposase